MFTYSDDFIHNMRAYYVEVGAKEDMPDPARFADRIVEREHFTLECRRKMPLSILGRYVDLETATVCDVGCGVGRNAALLADAGSLVTALDIDTQALKIARARSIEHGVAIRVVEGTVLDLPFSDSSVDIVISQNVLEHVPNVDSDRALSEMARVLRAGGVLFIQAPNKFSPIDIHTSLLPFVHWLPRSFTQWLKVLGIAPPHEDLPTYKEIIEGVNRHQRFDVLNRCDVWEDLQDFRSRWVNYSSLFGLSAHMYFRLIPIGYIGSRILRTELNKWLPVLNLFLRKVDTQVTLS